MPLSSTKLVNQGQRPSTAAKVHSAAISRSSEAQMDSEAQKPMHHSRLEDKDYDVHTILMQPENTAKVQAHSRVSLPTEQPSHLVSGLQQKPGDPVSTNESIMAKAQHCGIPPSHSPAAPDMATLASVDALLDDLIHDCRPTDKTDVNGLRAPKSICLPSPGPQRNPFLNDSVAAPTSIPRGSPLQRNHLMPVSGLDESSTMRHPDVNIIHSQSALQDEYKRSPRICRDFTDFPCNAGDTFDHGYCNTGFSNEPAGIDSSSMSAWGGYRTLYGQQHEEPLPRSLYLSRGDQKIGTTLEEAEIVSRDLEHSDYSHLEPMGVPVSRGSGMNNTQHPIDTNMDSWPVGDLDHESQAFCTTDTWDAAENDPLAMAEGLYLANVVPTSVDGPSNRRIHQNDDYQIGPHVRSKVRQQWQHSQDELDMRSPWKHQMVHLARTRPTQLDDERCVKTENGQDLKGFWTPNKLY